MSPETHEAQGPLHSETTQADRSPSKNICSINPKNTFSPAKGSTCEFCALMPLFITPTASSSSENINPVCGFILPDSTTDILAFQNNVAMNEKQER